MKIRRKNDRVSARLGFFSSKLEVDKGNMAGFSKKENEN
jgi:hypothetical protein